MPNEIGPASLTSPLLKLRDGRLAMSIETNKPYLDRSKWKQRAVYFHSSDEGRTWSSPVTVAEDPTGRIFVSDTSSIKILDAAGNKLADIKAFQAFGITFTPNGELFLANRPFVTKYSLDLSQ